MFFGYLTNIQSKIEYKKFGINVVNFNRLEKMKGKVIVSAFWTKLFSAGRASAVTIFPFIFVRRQGFKVDKYLINHERIHLAQALELLVFPFYTWYSVEFLFRFIQYRNYDKAYLNISFEREAYENEGDLEYLKKRKFWSFLKYIKTKKV